MKKLYLLLALAFIFLPSMSATTGNLGTFKQGECVNLLQTCADCTYNTITSVIYPNSTEALGVSSMDKTGLIYNYTFCDTNSLGTYTVNGYGDLGGSDTIWNYQFEITENGTDAPEGSVKIFFIIIFLVGLFFALISMLNCIAHWISLDCDIIDVGFSMGLYFVVFAFYGFSQAYMGNGMIENLLLIFIKVGWITHIVVPTLAFATSLFFNPFKKGEKNG